jgi:hypothetical protein
MAHAERFVERRSKRNKSKVRGGREQRRDSVIDDERRPRRLRPEDRVAVAPARARRGGTAQRSGG